MPLSSEEKELTKHILVHDEGMKLFPYVDCCSKSWKNCTCKEKGDLTIGVGRNLDKKGLAESEVMFLLDNDINDSTLEVDRNFGTWFNKLNSPRKMVIISMAFNMGINGLKTFKQMIKSIISGDLSSAASHMMNSKWSAQVGKRAVRLAETMRTGIVQG